MKKVIGHYLPLLPTIKSVFIKYRNEEVFWKNFTEISEVMNRAFARDSILKIRCLDGEAVYCNPSMLDLELLALDLFLVISKYHENLSIDDVLEGIVEHITCKMEVE